MHGEALAEIRLPESLANETGPYRIHPALLDSCFHLLGAALPADSGQSAYLLIGLERFTLFALPPEKLWNHTVLRPVSGSGREAFSGDIWLYDDDGRMVAEILGLHLKRATGEAMTRATEPKPESCFYEMTWREEETRPRQKKRMMDPILTADFIPAPVLLAGKAREKLRELVHFREAWHLRRVDSETGSSQRGHSSNGRFGRMGWSPVSGERYTTENWRNN